MTIEPRHKTMFELMRKICNGINTRSKQVDQQLKLQIVSLLVEAGFGYTELKNEGFKLSSNLFQSGKAQNNNQGMAGLWKRRGRKSILEKLPNLLETSERA